MVLHVLYQVIISNEIYLMCDALCVMAACHVHFAIFFFLRSFCNIFFLNYFFKFSFQPQIVLNLFLFFERFEPHCSYKVCS